MSIRVLIDARAVGTVQHGIGRYVFEIVRHVPEVAPDLEMTVIARPEAATQLRDCGVASVVISDVPFASPQAAVTLGRIQYSQHPDVTFSPSFIVPVVPRRPLVVTLHDATHLMFPGDYSRAVGIYYRLMTLPMARRAARVITVSEHSRRAFADLGVERVTVIPNGVDHAVFTPNGLTNPMLGPRTILYVGGFRPHKRVGLLFDALIEVPDATLAIVGEPPSELVQHACDLGIADRVQYLGRLPDAELANAYRAAAVLCYPSIYEGFGLPPLEAMACGTPVMVQDASSLPEVVADAGVRLSGGAKEWGAAIQRLIDDPVERERLSSAGLGRASAFSWKTTARNTADVIRSVAR